MNAKFGWTAGLVLFGVTSVWGDCSWLLWHGSVTKGGDGLTGAVAMLDAFDERNSDWKLDFALPTWETCAQFLESNVKATKESSVKIGAFKDVQVTGDMIATYWKNESKVTVHHFRCLPETIDPRKLK